MHDLSESDRFIKSALLVGLQNDQQTETETNNLLEELEELVSNLDVAVAAKILVKNRKKNPRFLVGTGKTKELLGLAEEHKVDAIIFDDELSPAQQRNWSMAANDTLLIIDRHEVILDIFNRRAHTREARLQVQLARMEYDLPRMKRAWTHLDRQKGGGAMQRDAGEKQIEIDQRLIRNRIAKLKKELAEVVKKRSLQRKKRIETPYPTAAIVGYTNAGKSTLLNALTHSEVFAKDKLFATLDPTTRRLDLPNGRPLLLTDTVGFVRKLPHRLIQAFKATLEEAIVSDFLIHVVDASNPDFQQHYQTTLQVLSELGAENTPRITVFNKMDLLEDPPLHWILTELEQAPIRVSAQTGEGLEQLKECCQNMLNDHEGPFHLLIPYNRYDILNLLHKSGTIESEDHEEDGIHLKASIEKRHLHAIHSFLTEKPTAIKTK